MNTMAKKGKKRAPKPRRKRRDDSALEADIMEATRQLVEEVGFPNVTLTGVIQRAGVEPQVFYKRYKDLGDLFEQFTRKYDYFLTDIMDIEAVDANPEKCYRDILNNLIPVLYENRGMQRLLVWELGEDNATTRRTAQLREVNTEEVTQKFADTFKGLSADFRSATSVLIGGIYYMILHSQRSTFCGIDYGTSKGKELLSETIDFFASALLDTLKPDAQSQAIAQKMKAKGIDAETIEECTGVRVNEEPLARRSK